MEPSPRETVFRSAKNRYLQNRDIDAHASWREWAWKRYARFWYMIGCLFLDVIVAGTVLGAGPLPTQAWQYGLTLLIVVGLTYLEFQAHLRLWPPSPPVE